MSVKIYFAGSIRGGRDDKKLYLQLIQHLTKYGQVLTEHVGNHNLTESGEDELSDDYIYNRDISWVQKSDVMIAEVSTPSLGTGYEISNAEVLDKKILCLYRNQENKMLSSMIAGNPNLKVARYETFSDAVKIIDEFFKSLN